MKLRSAIAIILASAVTATITILTGCATQPPPAPAAPPPPSPTMLNVRFAATATLLRHGQVLITGGVAHEGGSSATAELYDPATGGFALTGGLLTGRARHTATLLQNGKVLIAGGIGKAGKPVRPAELYDPASGRFLATGNMLEARYDHTATLLANGKVLIAGGGTTTLGVTNIDTAELYDPASGTFSQTGTVTRYYDPTSDEVFYKGDQTGTVTSYHDTTSDEFFYKGEMNAAHAMHTATLLPNGDVLIAGGMDADGKPQALVELYNPVTGKFTPTGSMNLARREHRATLLQNGQVLITGGLDAQERVLAIAELYDPATGKFALTTEAFPQTGTTMTDVRYEKTASILPNGQVLIGRRRGRRRGTRNRGALRSRPRLVHLYRRQVRRTAQPVQTEHDRLSDLCRRGATRGRPSADRRRLQHAHQQGAQPDRPHTGNGRVYGSELGRDLQSGVGRFHFDNDRRERALRFEQSNCQMLWIDRV